MNGIRTTPGTLSPDEGLRRIPHHPATKCSGLLISDTEGKRYLDGNASNWSKVHGHNDPDLNAALVEQMNQMARATRGWAIPRRPNSANSWRA